MSNPDDDRREPIFKDDEDRRRFLETLGEVCAKTGWQVNAYCFMPAAGSEQRLGQDRSVPCVLAAALKHP